PDILLPKPPERPDSERSPPRKGGVPDSVVLEAVPVDFPDGTVLNLSLNGVPPTTRTLLGGVARSPRPSAPPQRQLSPPRAKPENVSGPASPVAAPPPPIQ